ncbi:hypothetical protein Y1Q_0013589 [Alligator mississippiensis]|uniref:Uncharacterized protein n=1 Tax=Alligator mississippiensis TaxID=8496 RepID=A0A151P3K8_ALLMI|nr:hypothetical protein Y1Q_0013589 [Alligator mississippiensis]
MGRVKDARVESSCLSTGAEFDESSAHEHLEAKDELRNVPSSDSSGVMLMHGCIINYVLFEKLLHCIREVETVGARCPGCFLESGYIPASSLVLMDAQKSADIGIYFQMDRTGDEARLLKHSGSKTELHQVPE